MMQVVFPQRNALSQAFDRYFLCRRARSVLHAPSCSSSLQAADLCMRDRSRCVNAQVRSGSSVMGGLPCPVKVRRHLSLLRSISAAMCQCIYLPPV